MKKRKSAVDIFDSGLAQVTDAKFIPFSDHTVLSRDYLTAKLWDVRTAQTNGYAASSMIVDTDVDASPLWSAQVTDYMEKNLADLYGEGNLENDQFTLSVSPDGKHFATGAYNRSCHVMDVNATMNQAIVCRYG